MKIIVPIKQILDPQGISIRRDKERVFVNREEYVVDPASKAAVEAALRLKEASPSHVTALCLGQPRADDALREALAMGCDEAVLLSDKAFECADISVTARALAAAIRRLGGAHLILAGRRSSDTAAGQIGPRLAQALGYAQVADAYTLAVDGIRLHATRLWGAGFASVEADLPAVVTVAPEAFPPRLAHGARIMSAYREWQVPAWSAADLELEESALEPVLDFRREGFLPPWEREVLRGEPASAAREVVTALRQARLIP